MEPRAVERFTDAMAEGERAQTLNPYALDRTTGFYVKVRNVFVDAGCAASTS
jgi:hypothetical protein